MPTSFDSDKDKLFNTDKANVAFENLIQNFSNDQKKAAYLTIQEMKSHLYWHALWEMRVAMAVAMFVLTAFGFVSWSSIREDIVKAASVSLANNVGIQKDVTSEARAKIKEIDTSVAVLSGTLAKEFATIETMVAQIKKDFDRQKDEAHKDDPADEGK